jgi:hypothetical protein
VRSIPHTSPFQTPTQHSLFLQNPSHTYTFVLKMRVTCAFACAPRKSVLSVTKIPLFLSICRSGECALAWHARAEWRAGWSNVRAVVESSPTSLSQVCACHARSHCRARCVLLHFPILHRLHAACASALFWLMRASFTCARIVERRRAHVRAAPNHLFLSPHTVVL